MARKATRTGKVTGHGTDRWHSKDGNGPYVVLHGEITDDADPGRPVALRMTTADARHWAAGLIRMAEHIEATQGTSEAEQAPEPAKLTGGLANLLGVADKAPVEFTEERPGVWRTATPEDGARLDDAIDAALANLGTSLAELRESEAEDRDETPTKCGARNCGRTRPRWTMASRIVAGYERFECSPKFAMHCGTCNPPGDYMTHYTAEDHHHQDHMDGWGEDDRLCGLCGDHHPEADMYVYAKFYLCKSHDGSEVTDWVASLPL